MAAQKKFLAFLLILSLVAACFAGCGQNPAPSGTEPAGTTAGQTPADETTAAPVEFVDYAAELKLDMQSETAKQQVTVKQFIDGDTTHFHVPESVAPGGVLKARYLAINTPESTGQIEEYGKKASNFTKEKLSAAVSIIVESDGPTWVADSTGSRYLSWVWYKTADMEDYRCLNLEILQNGLAIASNSGGNRYGEIMLKAIAQAKAMKLNVHSGEPDPDFFYGAAVELDLKELRTNVDQYAGMRVAFTGVVTMNNNNSVYVESYDAETDMYYGMAVYYGFNLNGSGLEVLTVGNEVRIVGSLQYYEAGGTYQVSDLEYRLMKPDDPDNIQKLSEGHSAAYRLTDAGTFVNGVLTVVTDEGTRELPYGAMAMNTSLEMQNLTVIDTYTTTNEESSSKGAFTLTCVDPNGVKVTVRTVVLHEDGGKLVTADRYMGKTIDVKGIVDYFDGTYQIKVFSADNLIIK